MYSLFQECVRSGRGRTGQFRFANGKELETPYYFPVTTIMQSNTTRDPVRVDDLVSLWVERNRPQLVNILYWFDGSQSIDIYNAWREHGIENIMRMAEYPTFDAPIFMDSGGFKLRHAHNFDLTQYNIHPETMAVDILRYQLQLGGEIAATLDYPLLPGLHREEALDRINRSIEAAWDVASHMQAFSRSDYINLPFLYVSTHGQTSEDHKKYVDEIFERMPEDVPFGFAIGSCVGAPSEVHFSKLISTYQAIPEKERHRTCIHMFGVSGTFMPILAYLGADTFDSFAYAHAAASHDYKHPQTGKMINLTDLDIDNLPCECYACSSGLIANFKEASKKHTSTTSDHYAVLHLHNYFAELVTLQEYSDAIIQDSALEYIVDYMKRRVISENMTEYICDLVPEIGIKMDRAPSLFDLSEVAHRQTEEFSEGCRTISLNLTPDSFKISEDYSPPEGKRILLITPDGTFRPYKVAPQISALREYLLLRFGYIDEIHFATLVGLYGVVPEEFCGEKAINENCYSLTTGSTDKKQRALVLSRLRSYIEQTNYEHIVAYATAGAIRRVCLSVKSLTTIPDVMKVHSKGFTADVNFDELGDHLEPLLKNKYVEEQLSIFDMGGLQSEQY